MQITVPEEERDNKRTIFALPLHTLISCIKRDSINKRGRNRCFPWEKNIDCFRIMSPRPHDSALPGADPAQRGPQRGQCKILQVQTPSVAHYSGTPAPSDLSPPQYVANILHSDVLKRRRATSPGEGRGGEGLHRSG